MSMRRKWGYCHGSCCSGETNLDTECSTDEQRLRHEAMWFLDSHDAAGDLPELLADFAGQVVKDNDHSFFRMVQDQVGEASPEDLAGALCYSALPGGDLMLYVCPTEGLEPVKVRIEHGDLQRLVHAALDAMSIPPEARKDKQQEKP
mgnify:CR=1 FL=1